LPIVSTSGEKWSFLENWENLESFLPEK
jgi:hypothetical protein